MTEILRLETDKSFRDKLTYAAKVIREGGLVAFPTETVYGLGANALNAGAVKKIFIAKGRPSDNPLIAHISKTEDISRLASNIPPEARKLASEFWPGPLTMVLEKSDIVPQIITAGLKTVAIRLPSHPVAKELIELSGVPIAAPSANTSGKPSPTSAEHVIEDLMGKVDIILDAGECSVGLESTVVDLSVIPPVILRPGGVTQGQLERVLGIECRDSSQHKSDKLQSIPKAPGMKYTHYSPKAEMTVLKGHPEAVSLRIRALALEQLNRGIRTGIMATDQTSNLYPPGCIVISLGDRNNPKELAANLFKALRSFDEMGVDIIFAEAVEESDIGVAVMNRMKKAAGGNIIDADAL